jgi:hypothetical protein
MPKEQKAFEDLSDKELRQLLLQLDAVGDRASDTDKITTDDQLHAWIEDKLGINIPRVAVCPGHDAPFDFIADLFFKRVDSALVMANRGGGKSYYSALWSFLNAYWEPGVECLHVGAIEIQAKRVYSHVKQFHTKAAADKIAETTISQTLLTNGSKVEIVTGSKSSVNGPHSQRVHRDEVELMDKEVYQESLQIERAKKIDGKMINSQTLLTSTRKTPDGLMQELLDECAEAEQEGRKPPFKVYIFCIKECIEPQPKCRVAFPELPEEEKCICNEIQKGEWQEGEKRTFDQICNGALSKSDGFIPLDDAHKTFIKSSKAMWEAQQECKRPYVEDVSLPEFSKERHGIHGFVLDPANGPIYQGLDWGGTSPFAAIWMQVLDFGITVLDFKGDEKYLQEGTKVFFHEFYRAEISNSEFADFIVATERDFRMKQPKFRVKGRFGDPQGKAAKLELRRHDPPLICTWPAVTREREEHLKRMRNIVDNDMFAVDLDSCPMFVQEIEAWNIDIKKFDHAVDAGMYCWSNAYIIEQDRSKHTSEEPGIKKYLRPDVNASPFDQNSPGAFPSPLHGVKISGQSPDKWA